MKGIYLYSYLKWHNLKSNPNDLPRTTAWYIYKVRNSDDYRITYGYEKIAPNNTDYWARIPSPWEQQRNMARTMQNKINVLGKMGINKSKVEAIEKYFCESDDEGKAYLCHIDWDNFFNEPRLDKMSNQKLTFAMLRYGLFDEIKYYCCLGYVDGDEFIYGCRDKNEFCDVLHIIHCEVVNQQSNNVSALFDKQEYHTCNESTRRDMELSRKTHHEF